ncbi:MULTISPECIES: TatD family hydrolase [unclassified Vibrio]|uniref:TatD family hydrolase n=1 Tax=Vibrio sp. HB236076 TaxID=3232307 RepID=A0AB39HEQ7_9VIBR|nr:TatD family hydrolase [Vibrio sp. HB161653]MDP5255193.1 TatD family hydrolase [Vibrio sp. HB161653]
MIDTHAHIYAQEFDQDRDDVIARAQAQGIELILMPNIDIDSIAAMLNTEQAYPNLCRSMMGLHPCYVKEDYQQALTIIESYFDKHPFVAVGEIGLDLYWDKTFHEQQIDAFNVQLEWAKQRNLPVVIHTRDSIDESLEVVAKQQDGRLKGVFHCFGGSVEQAKAIKDIGFHVGLGGVSTFKNGGMDSVIPHLDMDYVVLETDSPYLAPVPNRGKRNEPAWTQLVGQRVAELRGLSLAELDAITTRNAKQLFSL